MHKAPLAILLAISIAACTKEPPACSDPSTVARVYAILAERLSVDAPSELALFRRVLTLGEIRPRAFDAKTRQFSCEGKVVVGRNDTQGGNWDMPIRFASQLGDKGDHIVVVDALSTDKGEEFYEVLGDGMRNVRAPEAPPAPAAATTQATDMPATASTEQDAGGASSAGTDGICHGLDTDVTMGRYECDGRKFTLADKLLNEQYQQRMKMLQPERQTALRISQRAWLKDKDRACEEAGKEYEGGSLERVVALQCEVRMTQERTTFLANYR